MSNEASGAGDKSAPGLDIEARNATVALADQWEAEALDAISKVDSPEQAEELLGKVKLADQAVRIAKLGADREQRWGRVRLKAERRYGELLPPKEQGQRTDLKLSPGGGKSKAEQRSKEKARKVASVPDEKFNEYVDKEPKPTREGLLKRSSSPRLVDDATVLEWVMEKRAKGWDRDRIVQASKVSTDGWPRPGASLSNGMMTTIIAVLKHEESPTVARASTLKRRVHQAKQAEKDEKPMGEGYTGLAKARRAILELTLTLQKLDVRQFGDDYIAGLDIDTIYEELVDMSEWFELHIGWFQARATELTVQRKIKALRNTTGRTDEEADTANKLADRLERKLRNRLIA